MSIKGFVIHENLIIHIIKVNFLSQQNMLLKLRHQSSLILLYYDWLFISVFFWDFLRFLLLNSLNNKRLFIHILIPKL